jgi:nicotinic acid mononucleotide adenylyltransferase
VFEKTQFPLEKDKFSNTFGTLQNWEEKKGKETNLEFIAGKSYKAFATISSLGEAESRVNDVIVVVVGVVSGFVVIVSQLSNRLLSIRDFCRGLQYNEDKA